MKITLLARAYLKDRGHSLTNGTRDNINYAAQSVLDVTGKKFLTKELAADVINTWQRNGMAASTISSKIKLLSGMSEWGISEGYMSENPWRRLNIIVPRREPTRFSVDEYQRILAAARQVDLSFKDWPLFIVLAWNTGMRISDILTLKWKEVDWANERIRKVAHKTRKKGRLVDVPLLPEAYKALENHFAGALHEYVFPDAAVERSFDGGHRIFCEQFRKILSKAGVVGKTFHTFRHTFISRCIEGGVSAELVSSITGQSIVTIMETYAAPSISSKREAMMAAFEKVI